MIKRLLSYTEPAAARGIAVAIVSLVAALGFTLPFDLPGVVNALAPVAAFLVPLLQGLWTRSAVYSPAAVYKLRAAGPQTPGIADHAA